jgi:hypothetical protein
MIKTSIYVLYYNKRINSYNDFTVFYLLMMKATDFDDDCTKLFIFAHFDDESNNF